MNEQETPPESASNPLYRSAVVFVAGIALGALMMVEIVPASSMVEVADIGTAPTDGGTVADGTGGDTLAEGEDGTTDGGVEIPGQESTGQESSGTDGSSTDGGGSGGDGNGNTGNTGNTGDGTGNTDDDAKDSTQAGVQCAPGRNGGATDQGVTANEIQMATTVVESGIGSSFLGETRSAMEAVRLRVNGEGGICGRQLEIKYVDDAWSPQDGAQHLRTFINQGVFAIPVGPSSEGLNLVIDSGDFDKHKVPVVGTNGLSILQYERDDGTAQQWVWPVAAATVSSARIMAKDAYDRMKKAGEDPSAEHFSVVFASNYRFGAEGAEAFNAEVKRLTGGNIPGYKAEAKDCDRSYCAVNAGAKTSYSQEVAAFEEGQFVAMFLEPQTARAWMNDNNAPAAEDPDIPFGFGVAQPLFTKQFGDQCGSKCHTMLVWTGFKPYQEHYVSDPDVQRYVNDLQRSNRNADPNNQFSLGAYIGMELLVEAIKAVGPELTREKLKEELDTMTFDSGLTLADPMQFSADNRYVATTMQAWEFQAVGSFSGWSAQQIVTDPKFGG